MEVCRTCKTPIDIHSLPEAARILETFKAYEKKPADTIMERQNKEYLGRVWAGVSFRISDCCS